MSIQLPANCHGSSDRRRWTSSRTGCRVAPAPLAAFREYVLLTNFDNYVEWFATLHGGLVTGLDRAMPNATADGITLINLGMGSPNAPTVMDLLSAIAPKAVLFLGKRGVISSLHRSNAERFGAAIFGAVRLRYRAASDQRLIVRRSRERRRPPFSDGPKRS